MAPIVHPVGNPRTEVDHSAARQRFHNVLGASASPYLVVFDDLTIVDLNESAETFLEHAASTLWGKTLGSLLDADDQQTVRRSTDLAQGDATATWPAVLLSGTGQRIEVELMASTIARAGDPGRFYLILELALPAAAATRRALRAEASYDRLMALTHEGVWEIDAEGRTVSANARMADMLGCSLSDLEHRSLMEFLDDDGQQEARAALDRRSKGVAEQRDVVFRRSDGSTLHALVSATPRHDADGTFLGSLAVVLDLTERVEREARLRRADDQFTQSFDLAPIPKALIGTDGRFDRVNPAICDFLGVPEAELVGTHYLDVLAEVPSDEKEAGWDGVIQGTRQTYSTELRCKHAAGYDAWARLTISGLTDADGEVDSLVVQLVDITDEKLEQTSLREALDRYTALFEHAPTGVTQLTLDGRILAANPAFADLLGHEPAKLSGRSIHDTVHADEVDRVRSLLAELRESDGQRSASLRFRHASGAAVSVVLAAATIPGPSGRPSYVVATITRA